MPRPKDPAIAQRDREILQLITEGWSCQKTADHFGISKQRVSQITLAQYDGLTSDETRAWMRTGLERLAQELMVDALGPGKRIMTAKGPAYELDEDGDPDYTRPLFDRIARRDSAETIVKIYDRLSKNYGLDPWRIEDKQDNPEVDQLIAWAQQNAVNLKQSLDEIAELKAKLTRYEHAAIENVVEVEVVPPSD